MIKRGEQITSSKVTEIFQETVRDLNEVTYNSIKSLSTGCFSGDATTYGELLNVSGQQFLQYDASYVKEFTDIINELKSRKGE